MRELGCYVLLEMKEIPVNLFKVEWYPMYGPKSLFRFGEKRSIVCYCTHEQKIILKMVAMATSHSFLRQGFIGLAPTLLALSQNKIRLLNKHIL